jgi:hypothetical protein
MTPQERNKLTHDRIVASLLLADTRSQRHGVYPRRKPARKPHQWSLPVVNERRL